MYEQAEFNEMWGRCARLQRQARFMSAAAPPAAAQAPCLIKPQARKERQRVAGAAIG